MKTLQLQNLEHINAGSKALDFADGFCYVAGIAGLFVPNPVSIGCYVYGAGRLFL